MRIVMTMVLAATFMGAVALAQAQQVTAPGAPTTPVERPKGLGAPKGPLQLPDLRITALAPETPGLIRGRWYRATVKNVGRGPVGEGVAMFRARVLGVKPFAGSNTEILVTDCVVADLGTDGGGSARCGGVFVGPLAPGASQSVRLFLQGAPLNVATPYRVEVGIDVCGTGYADAGASPPDCAVSELNERNNAMTFSVRDPVRR